MGHHHALGAGGAARGELEEGEVVERDRLGRLLGEALGLAHVALEDDARDAGAADEVLLDQRAERVGGDEDVGAGGREDMAHRVAIGLHLRERLRRIDGHGDRSRPRAPR